MSDLPKEIQMFQAGIKMGLLTNPPPVPEDKGSSLFKTGIRPLIDDWLINKSREKRDYGDYWSASSAGYCMRRVIFERLGVPHTTEDARKQRVFTSGQLFHDWIQGITKKAGLSIAQELELQDEELMIRGHIDDLVYFPFVGGELNAVAEYRAPQNHLILYDYKTQNSRAFSYKRPAMSHYHRMQLGTYMYMLRNSKPNQRSGVVFDPQQLTEARILKISKDDLRMSEEQLLWTPELEQEVVGYWSELNRLWKAKKLPLCTCAEKEGGFMAQEKWNGYFFDGEPCSLGWYQKWKSELKEVKDDSTKEHTSPENSNLAAKI